MRSAAGSKSSGSRAATERAEELERALQEATRRRTDLAAQLSERRANAARRLRSRSRPSSTSLRWSGAKLEVVLEPHPDGFGAWARSGLSSGSRPIPGMPVSPLRDAASGGELSRVMLALAGQGARAGAATFVFDEIDAGIGGNTAQAVGERLRSLGTERQVLCITHLPQVASLADAHFRSRRTSAAARRLATVEQVDGEELVDEIVRMLGADRGDETASRHARELLEAA